jgi:hypothetical protein
MRLHFTLVAIGTHATMSMIHDECGPPIPLEAVRARGPSQRPTGVNGYAMAINRLRVAAQKLFERESTCRCIACAFLDQVNTVLSSSNIDGSVHDVHMAVKAIEGVHVENTKLWLTAKALVTVAVAEWIAGRDYDNEDLDKPLRGPDRIVL